ncbi:hypothetical protein F4778DRAFT_78213 [Xylariomycetidae sp. FL2044]|nr:hypothetical protein F4778DRAFT_78213 [Xylariomycetidae sp. FL2044]
MDPNQAQQPYQPYYQQPPRVVPQISKPWQITKIVFASLSIVFSIILLGISIATTAGADLLSYVAVWTAPQAGIAIIWSTAELITICARAGHRGIHPGAHVALHLLLWLGFCVAQGLNGFILASSLAYNAYYDSYDDYYSDYYGYDDYDYSYSPRYISYLQAVLAFTALLIIVHFFLFVRACVETAQRNSMARPVYMMPPQMYYAPPMQPGFPTQQPMQPGFPAPPPQAHMSGYYGQPGGEAQTQPTESSTGHQSQVPAAGPGHVNEQDPSPPQQSHQPQH